jgi:hypothetical protein
LAYRQNKFTAKDQALVIEDAKKLLTEIEEHHVCRGLTKAAFTSALVRYLCTTQKLNDKLFQNLYKD